MFTKRPSAPPDPTDRKWLTRELAEARRDLPAAEQAVTAAADQLDRHLERVHLLGAALAVGRAELERLRGDGVTVRTVDDPDIPGARYLIGGERVEGALAVLKARKAACDEAGDTEAELRVALGEAARRRDDLRGRERGALSRLEQLDAPAPPRPDPMQPPTWIPPGGLWKDGAG